MVMTLGSHKCVIIPTLLGNATIPLPVCPTHAFTTIGYPSRNINRVAFHDKVFACAVHGYDNHREVVRFIDIDHISPESWSESIRN